MKKILITSFVCIGGILFAQKIDHNPNRDPILKEQVPGFRITTPNKLTKICLCCNKNATNRPLVVLDGKEITDEDFKKINSQTIQSIDVLKDAKAIELYGEKGKNGVLLIQSRDKAEKKQLKKVEKEPILAI